MTPEKSDIIYKCSPTIKQNEVKSKKNLLHQIILSFSFFGYPCLSSLLINQTFWQTVYVCQCIYKFYFSDLGFYNILRQWILTFGDLQKQRRGQLAREKKTILLELIAGLTHNKTPRTKKHRFQQELLPLTSLHTYIFIPALESQ